MSRATSGTSVTGPSQYVNGDNVLRPAPTLAAEEQQAQSDARDAWQARCRPRVSEDREGLRRTRYAEPDCDISRFNTAEN
jgi:hypothetical protein